MSPHCHQCGSCSTTLPGKEAAVGLMISREWNCSSCGHNFWTYEVPGSFLNSTSLRKAAEKAIKNRIERFNRNNTIRQQVKVSEDVNKVASIHKLTPAMIRRITNSINRKK